MNMEACPLNPLSIAFIQHAIAPYMALNNATRSENISKYWRCEMQSGVVYIALNNAKLGMLLFEIRTLSPETVGRPS